MANGDKTKACSHHPFVAVTPITVTMNDNLVIGPAGQRYTGLGRVSIPEQVRGKTITYYRCPVCETPPGPFNPEPSKCVCKYCAR